jgi:PAS domain S-box-containing protein
MFGTIQDITERKRDEQELRRSQAYLAEAQRLTHTASWAWSPLTSETPCWSEEMFRIFGFDPRQGPPTSEAFWERVHPEDRDGMYELMRRAAREKTEYEHDHRIVLPDGTVKHIHAIGHPVVNRAGDAVEFVGTAVDVTERKRAEEALQRSEVYLAEAQRLTRTGSWAFSLITGKMVYWSDELFRVWGFDPQKCPPNVQAILHRIHPEDRERMGKLLKSGFKGLLTQDAVVDLRIVLPDGTVKYLEGISYPVFDDAGRLIEYVGTGVDVTDRKRAEDERERLRQVEADLAHIGRVTTLGELAASLAHELHQPITAAITNANTGLRWLAREIPDI